MVLTLAEFPWPTWLIGIVTVLFWIVCIIMVLTVLIQKPQGGGLSGAFGSGAGAGQTAFGTKTGDVLTLFTIVVFVLFIASAAVLGVGSRPLSREDLMDRAEREAEKNAQPQTPPGTTGTTGTPGTTGTTGTTGAPDTPAPGTPDATPPATDAPKSDAPEGQTPPPAKPPEPPPESPKSEEGAPK